jgi:hypothetical protein
MTSLPIWKAVNTQYFIFISFLCKIQTNILYWIYQENIYKKRDKDKSPFIYVKLPGRVYPALAGRVIPDQEETK